MQEGLTGLYMEDVKRMSHRKKSGFKIRCRKPGQGVTHYRTTTEDAGFSLPNIYFFSGPVVKNKVMLIVGPVIQTTQ